MQSTLPRPAVWPGSAFMWNGRKKNGMPAEERTASGDRLMVGIDAELFGVVPGSAEHPASRDVRDDHDQLVALVGRQRAAGIVLLEVSPGPHVLRRQPLGDPGAEETRP